MLFNYFQIPFKLYVLTENCVLLVPNVSLCAIYFREFRAVVRY